MSTASGGNSSSSNRRWNDPGLIISHSTLTASLGRLKEAHQFFKASSSMINSSADNFKVSPPSGEAGEVRLFFYSFTHKHIATIAAISEAIIANQIRKFRRLICLRSMMTSLFFSPQPRHIYLCATTPLKRVLCVGI